VSEKPNILLLYCDQLNARLLGFNGNKDIKTPNLDSLAENAFVFDNAYCNNPICTPSRMSLLSGQYASTHGYYGLYGEEPHPLTSMFKTFSEQGYRCGALGKLHTPRYWVEKDADYVYDEFLEFPKYLEGAGLYEDNDNRFYEGVVTGKASKLPYEHSCESALAKLTLRFVSQNVEKNEKVKADEPWFAWVSFARPHQPYTPSEPFASLYPAESVFLPPVDGSEKDSVKKQRSEVKEEKLRDCVSAYMGLISQIDHSIGLIMEGLKESGQLENTILAFTTDHGDFAGEHGLYSKIGGISYKAVTKVPLFFCDFRENKTGRSDELIESVDVFPTLCDMAGLKTPNTVQGFSFFEHINGREQKKRSSALTENIHRKALATRDFRYISNLEGESDELYDLRNDPWEHHNLIDDEAYKDKLAEMSRLLLKRLSQARKPYNSLNGFWYHHHYDDDGRMDMKKNAEPGAQW
jgi:arylsulfatase A-like enzyme